jgi:hypothetical protein
VREARFRCEARYCPPTMNSPFSAPCHAVEALVYALL